MAVANRRVSDRRPYANADSCANSDTYTCSMQPKRNRYSNPNGDGYSNPDGNPVSGDFQ